MKEVNGVQSPFTDPIVPPPSGAGNNVASTGGIDLGEGSAPASSFEGGPINQTYQPKEGVPVPSKLEGTVSSRTSGYGRVPTT